jgi:hypothetical protein
VADHRLPEYYICPSCQTSLTGASNTGPEQEGPQPGDYTVCVHCTTALIFTEDGLRPMVEADVDDMSLAKVRALLRVIEIVQVVHSVHNRRN